MRITYVARSFLDYRIPVFENLDSLCGRNLRIIYNRDYVPERVHDKIRLVLGDRAIGLSGEKRIGPNEITGFANASFRIVYQTGLLKEIRKTKPDVLIGDGFFQWTGFALLHRILHHIPLAVCYERTAHTERNAQWIRTAYRKIVLRWIGAMSCNGILSSEYTQTLGIEKDFITTGHMVADTGNLAAAKDAVTGEERTNLRKKWGANGIVFLAVGRLIAPKGYAQLLEVWARFEKDHPAALTLIIVGEGEEEANLHALVERLGIKSVHFEGSVDYDSIAPYYAASDVFIMPTLEDNWSLVVPEAMVCGLPVLCSKYNGCYPELVRQGENGWVFDPMDQKETCAVMAQCVESGDRLSAMGKRSEEIIADYTPETAAQAIFDACEIAARRLSG